MRIRLTDIALSTGAGVFPIGAVLVVGEDIDAGLAQLRLEANTAELVGEDGDLLSPAFATALQQVGEIFDQLDIAIVAVLTAAESADASLADARAFVDLMRDPPLTALERMPARFYAIKRRVIDAEDAALTALDHIHSSTEGPQAQVVDEAASAAASEDAVGDGPAASEVLSAVEPTVEEASAAPPAEAEPPAAAASTDTPPQTEQPATAELAAVAEVSEGDPPKAKAKARAKAGGNPATGS